LVPPRRLLPPLFTDTPATPAGSAEHAWYRACRDHVTKRGIRAALTRIWNAHGHLLPEAPEQFVDQFRRDFPARSWELYVLDWLARSGATPERSPGTGPDFCAQHPRTGRIWIECVAPTPGTGANRVWERDDHTRVWSGPPDEPLALRYTSVVQAKIAKIIGYRNSNIIGRDEPVVIALNQGGIRDSDLHDVELPLSMMVLYGVGDTVLRVDPFAHTSEVEVQERVAIQNRSGAQVSAVIFAEAASTAIAGVMIGRTNVFNLFGGRRRRLLMAHNPNATAHLPVGLLPFRGEIWVGDDRRLIHRGIVSEYGPFARHSRRRPDTSPGPQLRHE
jgi:hypothetical protein